MRYSYPIEQAIRAVAILHAGQVRKGPVQYPYITHIFATTLLVADYTDDENTIVTALLSDTLSDTDYTPTEMEQDFGGTIQMLVSSITEPMQGTMNSHEFGDVRKAFIKQLKNVKEEALLVLAAKKVHSMRTTIEEYADDLSAFISDFGPNQEPTIIYYQELSNALNRRLTNAILTEFNDVFTEYKQFLHDVKAKSEDY